ncbi:DUF7139 domain-containing protein [Natronolimnohabitans innermongolicus]|uniref:Uncharacterized protein n=1 Tax=Natronolimnohabitans innermongolicus JCM 12255 TaxID=1227499 RepID=L9WNY8_9EURY|nr:hypothetical protein [Natronolimnohabitans innermongolicus]ELY51179.1 hypothetical protein C493_17746 [Natronolimnohabitans innermongolicus JCM 12255]
MTSLTEVYDGTAREVASPWRLYGGTALVLLGALLAVVAVVVATTDLFSGAAAAVSPGMDAHYASIRVAGVLAGLGVPIALVGVFLVLPAGRRVHAAAAISVSLCLLGVVLFWDAYPHDWRSYGADHTLRVSAVYLLGLFMALWSLFTAVVNFKTRNDPGGALEMNVTRQNKTVVEVTESDRSGGLGGIGFLGSTPDGEVETQTNADDSNGETLSYDESSTVSGSTESGNSSPRSTAGTAASSSTGGSGSGGRKRRPTPGVATSDGGTAASDITSPLDAGDGRDAEIVDGDTTPQTTPQEPAAPTDRYCGNCQHFEYVRSSEGMVPYCARHERAMDDMDACEEWAPNR